MGQNSSKGDKNTVAEYKPQFEVIRVIDDPNYGRVKLIRENKTHQQMILKEFIFDTKQAFEEELKFFKERAAFDHPHIVQVIGYNATQNQNLCSSLFKVSVFIEIISKELYTVLRERKRSKAAFSEGDLLIIAENVIQALYHLQTKNMAHGDIRPLNIFVTGQSYKVTDPKLEIDKNANALVKAVINNSETLLSPQLVAKIPTKKFEITEDRYKADVFSLGATMLNVATLKNSEELYDYQAGKIKEDLLRERLEEVKHQYSPFTYQLISDMLKINEQERPDFVDLRDRLLPHHEAINTKGDLPFITHHQQVETFGNVPAAVQKQGGERAKKAAVLIPDEDREERLPSFASETHHTAAFGQPQRTEPVFHHHEDHYVPAAINHQHEQHYVEPPQYKSNFDTDDLEAKIRAALQRSQNTYKQVQESEAHYGTHQHQPQPQTTQFVSDFHSQRPLVSFGPSSDFVQTQQQNPHATFYEHTHSFVPEHRVNAPRQPGYEEYMRESQRQSQGQEHRVMAPRQPGWEVEVSREVTGGEHRVMAPRQPGIEVEINRNVGGERRVNAPRQPGIEEEQVKKSALPQAVDHDDVHVHAPQHHVEVPATRTSGFIYTEAPATRTSGFIHTEVPATRTSGFIQTSEPHVAPQKVEEYHHYVPSTTPATYEFSYTGNTYTPNTGYATQNLGLLESLKKTSEAALAHQQELQRQSETQNFANAQPTSYQHESIHTYQPASYTTTSYDIGAPTSYGTTAVRTGDEHVVRSTPAATDDVRKVGEVGGNSAYNAGTFTYTPGQYAFSLPKAAADDVFAFTPQTYTVEHTAAPQTTTTYNYTTGTLGQGYGHHEPASYTTTDYHFTTAAPGGYTAYGTGNDTKANGETEKVLKSYHVEETPQIQNREVSYSPTLPSVTPKHHVTNIQTTEFGRGDTVTYGTHTPTNAYPGADRPGGILGEVSSAVSKYTFTTVEEGGQNQLGDSPARFI